MWISDGEGGGWGGSTTPPPSTDSGTGSDMPLDSNPVTTSDPEPTSPGDVSPTMTYNEAARLADFYDTTPGVFMRTPVMSDSDARHMAQEYGGFPWEYKYGVKTAPIERNYRMDPWDAVLGTLEVVVGGGLMVVGGIGFVVFLETAPLTYGQIMLLESFGWWLIQRGLGRWDVDVPDILNS